MKIEFELRAEDGRETRRAYYRHLRSRFERYFLPCIGLLLMADPVWEGLEAIASGRGLHHLSRGTILMFLEGWLLLVVGWIAARRGPLGALRHPGRGGIKTLDIGDDGITIGDPGRFAVSSFPWSDFSRFVETENLFILLSLYPTNAASLFAYRAPAAPACLYVIPKRAFAAGEMEEFRKLLKQRMPDEVRGGRTRTTGR